MYFVTTKRAGYILFSMTPSERAAVGVTEQQAVHVLVHDRNTGEWTVLAAWNVDEFSHTDFMAAWHRRDEPADPAQLLEVLPAHLRRPSS